MRTSAIGDLPGLSEIPLGVIHSLKLFTKSQSSRSAYAVAAAGTEGLGGKVGKVLVGLRVQCIPLSIVVQLVMRP